MGYKLRKYYRERIGHHPDALEMARSLQTYRLIRSWRGAETDGQDTVDDFDLRDRMTETSTTASRRRHSSLLAFTRALT
jgi:hypothetical protein